MTAQQPALLALPRFQIRRLRSSQYDRKAIIGILVGKSFVFRCFSRPLLGAGDLETLDEIEPPRPVRPLVRALSHRSAGEAHRERRSEASGLPGGQQRGLSGSASAGYHHPQASRQTARSINVRSSRAEFSNALGYNKTVVIEFADIGFDGNAKFRRCTYTSMPIGYLIATRCRWVNPNKDRNFLTMLLERSF